MRFGMRWPTESTSETNKPFTENGACVDVAPIVSEGVRAAVDAVWDALSD